MAACAIPTARSQKLLVDQEVRSQVDAARAQADAMRSQADAVRAQADVIRAKVATWDRGTYEQGAQALDNRKYDQAIKEFDRVIASKSPRSDGAYYWKAYALNKLGKRDEALAALGELTKQFPQSRWQNDVKALELEVRQSSGQPASPEAQADEDLRLYAINALINTDPERAIPLLEKVLNDTKYSPRLKRNALFVLAQSRSDKAREIVGGYAKGGTNPDLQLKAVEYLGTYRSKESQQILADTYASVSDVNVKRAVLRGFMMSRDTGHLLSAAKSETNADLRHEAIHQLGMIRDEQASSGLVSLYAAESDKTNKLEILNALWIQGSAKQLVEVVRKENDPELKKSAVQKLSMMRSKEATDYLMELLTK